MQFPKVRTILTCVLMGLSAAPLAAQKKTPQKFNDAIKRSEGASELIIKLAQLPQNGIPKELVDKAEAIGVFPCKKTDLLIEHAVICPGVISRRLPDGWSLPAYYRFGGGGFGRPDQALRDSGAMILLFMDKNSIGWLEKGILLKNEKAAAAGSLGTMNVEQKERLRNAHIIAYSYRKDVLVGRDLKESGFLRGIALGQDRHLNENLYGIKGHEVLAGKNISSTSLPTGITAFQQALKKYYNR